MPLRNRFDRSIQIKFEIAELDHEIHQMQVDLEYAQKQSMLIRQAIDEKENSLRELFSRLERYQEVKRRVGRDHHD